MKKEEPASADYTLAILMPLLGYPTFIGCFLIGGLLAWFFAPFVWFAGFSFAEAHFWLITIGVGILNLFNFTLPVILYHSTSISWKNCKVIGSGVGIIGCVILVFGFLMPTNCADYFALGLNQTSTTMEAFC